MNRLLQGEVLFPSSAMSSGPSTEEFSKDRCFFLQVDASFETSGTWAGVLSIIEPIFAEARRSQSQDLIDAHHYELHMVLSNERHRLPLKYGSLTDLVQGAEKTRNFPLDRAYRIVHGLVEFVIDGCRLLSTKEMLVIGVKNLERAQHLACRFFLELARRSYARGNIRIVVLDGWRELPQEYHNANVARLPILMNADCWDLVKVPDAAISTADEAERCFEALNTLEGIEQNYSRLLLFYKSADEPVKRATTALAALHVCNHLGFYHEASTFVDAILPCFHKIVGDDEEKRWNYVGNMFQSLVVTGAVNRAKDLVEELAKPFLTSPTLQAKMEYIFGILALRYSAFPDLAQAEKHLIRACELIAVAKDDLDIHEHAFLTVFIENGLAFLRVRQGRGDEAIQLCQAGYELLTRELGDEVHKLHRSVLQYNTAQVYTMSGQLGKALVHYQHACLMDPFYSEYYNEMGNVHQRLGDFDRALGNYAKAIKFSAPYPEVHFNVAVCLSRRGEWVKAREACSYSLTLKPRQPDALLLQAEIYEQLGLLREALQSYNEVLMVVHDSVPALVNKAVVLNSLGETEVALSTMMSVIAIEQEEAAHYENRAFLYRQLKMSELAEEDELMAERCRSQRGVSKEQRAA